MPDANPYLPSQETTLTPRPPDGADSRGILGTRWRRIGLAIAIVPFLVFFPLRYWFLNHAGGWVITLRIDPEMRRIKLGLAHLFIMAAITATTTFLWIFILFCTRYRRFITGILLIPTSIGFVAGMTVFYLCLWSFWNNR